MEVSRVFTLLLFRFMFVQCMNERFHGIVRPLRDCYQQRPSCLNRTMLTFLPIVHGKYQQVGRMNEKIEWN